MTGFADSRGALDNARWRWEAKSVNGRGLEVRLRLPVGLEGIEQAARVLAGERFHRGNIQATLTFEPQDNARALKVDPAALAAAVRIAREVASETGLAPARVDGLMALKGVLVQDEALAIDTPARAARDAAILESLSLAFDALAPTHAHLFAEFRVGQKGIDGGGELVGVAVLHDVPGHAILYHFRCATVGASDYRFSAGHSFQIHEPETLAATRQREQLASGITGGQLGVAEIRKEVHVALYTAVARGVFEPGAIVAGTGHH
jgi:hypothetical protein